MHRCRGRGDVGRLRTSVAAAGRHGNEYNNNNSSGGGGGGEDADGRRLQVAGGGGGKAGSGVDDGDRPLNLEVHKRVHDASLQERPDARSVERDSVSGNVQIPLDGPDQTLSLVWSRPSLRVVHKFRYSDPTRPDPRTAWVYDKSTDLVWSQTCPLNLDVYGLCPWVWSGRVADSQWVRVVNLETTRPYPTSDKVCTIALKTIF